ncbi:sensor histidine kinase [Nocardiopsis chromatogenes]|uniref:sensor histidine kinase n=1 Tax=Nocardiopsis chromatogenes TaxID=280239 RepID=UPI000347732A|nr:HAMP domain-containing sensor histidine kinase [Nocardiopsis chromatogenes]
MTGGLRRAGAWAHRLRPRGLRARLLVAFVLVTVVGAAAAAWAAAGSAGTALVGGAQERLTGTVADRVGALAPELDYPPDRETLDRLRAAVGPNTLVTYEDLRSADADAPGPGLGAVRGAVRERNRIVVRRITDGGTPRLLVGMPVMLTTPDGERTPSGIEVYTVRDLSGIEGQVDVLTRSAGGASALALPLAVLLALLAARGVLRPVRDLRDTARRLADGDLGARTAPQGADELAALTSTVNEMAASLQASMAQMERMRADARRFASDVSHELRTPLSTLTAVVDVLASEAEEMEADDRESVELAVAETRRLVRLVEDLMEVSRFDAGSADLRLEEADAAEAVRDCLRARGWTDRVAVEAEGRVGLRADRRRLDVIVANLVGNALRHGAPPVRVHVAADGDEVRIEVDDGGPGLSEDVLPRVFDRFSKGDAARTRSPGSGLGLAIALENARLHGGDLTAENTGGGAQFVLRLPRTPRGEEGEW